MRIDRFKDAALEAYRKAPEVASAEEWAEGTSRPCGVEVRFTGGGTVRHAITMVTPPGDDLAGPEETVEGEAPAPVEPRPAAGGPHDRQTARLLAAILADAAHPEFARVYAYAESSTNPGLGADMHSGHKMHMLLL